LFQWEHRYGRHRDRGRDLCVGAGGHRGGSSGQVPSRAGHMPGLRVWLCTIGERPPRAWPEDLFGVRSSGLRPRMTEVEEEAAPPFWADSSLDCRGVPRDLCPCQGPCETGFSWSRPRMGEQESVSFVVSRCGSDPVRSMRIVGSDMPDQPLRIWKPGVRYKLSASPSAQACRVFRWFSR
jgi:hypothetical protein